MNSKRWRTPLWPHYLRLAAVILLSTIATVAGLGWMGAFDPQSATALANPASAGANLPYLVRDINPETEPSTPTQLVAVSQTLFFFANDGLHGNELWTSDGTFTQTNFVAEVAPGGGQSDDAESLEAIEANGEVFFVNRTLHTYSGPRELWKSDGTPQGTLSLTQLSLAWWHNVYLTHVGGVIFFQDYIEGFPPTLWKSDSTPTGTIPITSFVASAGTGALADFIAFQGKLFFTFDRALWSSDGTPTGTLSIAPDIEPTILTRVNDRLFFSACDSQGCELWKSDGTPAGTALVRDIYSGTEDSAPAQLASAGNRLFFTACEAVTGCELWVSDGSPTGTVLVKDIVNGPNSPTYANLTDVNGVLFFTLCDMANQCGLWRSDGTPVGTVLVADLWPIYPSGAPTSLSNLTALGDSLFFTANDGVSGQELWMSDGTFTGTVLLMDILPGLAGSSPQELTVVNNRLFFSADDGPHGVELWQTDGTLPGTTLIRDIRTQPAGSQPSRGVRANDTFVFSANDGSGPAVWASAGSLTQTVKLQAVEAAYDSYVDQTFLEMNGTAFFGVAIHAPYLPSQLELWKSDGTPTGTVLIRSFLPGVVSVPPNRLTNVDGRLFFMAINGGTGSDLWVSEGTPSDTVTVMHIEAEDPISFQDRLFFNAYAGSVLALWSTDGTLTGTLPITSLTSTTIDNCDVVGEQLFFYTYLNATTRQLWRSDGTASGTLPLQAVGSSYSGFDCADYQERMYFTGNLSDHELWVSDGTPAGTQFVTVTEPDPAGGGIRYLTAANDSLYFSAFDPVAGRELWKSDGTAPGTFRFTDLNPGLGDSSPQNLTTIFDTLYFTADDGVHGEELWQSDGTPAGTFMVADIYSGTSGSRPTDLSLFQSRFHATLFFQADDGQHGRELWAIRLHTYPYETVLPLMTQALFDLVRMGE